jgi:hypothetical protein
MQNPTNNLRRNKMIKQIVAIAITAAFGIAHAADVKPAVAEVKAAAAPTAAVVKSEAIPKAAVMAMATICLMILFLLRLFVGFCIGFAESRCLVSNNAGRYRPDVRRKVTRCNALSHGG